MCKVQNSLNYDFKAHRGEINRKPSLTVPDQTMSLKDIISRFVRGLPLPSFGAEYNEDGDVPDFNKMDLSEIYDWRDLHTQKLTDLRDKAVKEGNEARQKQLEAEEKQFEERFKKYQNEKSQKGNLPDVSQKAQ